jgi:hypothetical protein
MYREDHRLRISKNGVISKSLDLRRSEKRKLEGSIVKGCIVICIPQLR